MKSLAQVSWGKLCFGQTKFLLFSSVLLTFTWQTFVSCRKVTGVINNTDTGSAAPGSVNVSVSSPAAERDSSVVVNVIIYTCDFAAVTSKTTFIKAVIQLKAVEIINVCVLVKRRVFLRSESRPSSMLCVCRSHCLQQEGWDTRGWVLMASWHLRCVQCCCVCDRRALLSCLFWTFQCLQKVRFLCVSTLFFHSSCSPAVTSTPPHS